MRQIEVSGALYRQATLSNEIHEIALPGSLEWFLVLAIPPFILCWYYCCGDRVDSVQKRADGAPAGRCSSTKRL